MNPAEHPAIVLTLSPTGLAVARALGRRGVRVLGIDATRTEVGHFSRYVERDPRISTLPPGRELLERLLEFGNRLSHSAVLYAAGDTYIDFLCSNHELLRTCFILPDSMRPELMGALLDKMSFYAGCQELGVAIPRTFLPRSLEEAAAAARDLRYPAIVKPTHGHLFRKQLAGGKLALVDDAEQLLGWWRRFQEWGGVTVLQEVIPGPESNIFVAALYVDRTGEPRSVFTARKSRQYPPMFGSGSYMEACWAPEIAEMSNELVRKLTYTGICGTEYKWDPRDETWKLIELNPRPTLWFALPPAAGVDVVWDAHCDLVGVSTSSHIGAQQDRVRWQLPLRDVLAGLYFLRQGELPPLGFLRTVVDPRRKVYGDLALDDPGITVGILVDAVAKYSIQRRDVG